MQNSPVFLAPITCLVSDGRKEVFYLMTYLTHFIYGLYWTYGKGPLRYQEGKTAATTWDTLSD